MADNHIATPPYLSGGMHEVEDRGLFCCLSIDFNPCSTVSFLDAVSTNDTDNSSRLWSCTGKP